MLIVFLLALNSQSDLFNSFPPSFFLRILYLPSFTCVFCPNRLILIDPYMFLPLYILSLSSLLQWGSSTHIRIPVCLSFCLTPWASSLSRPWALSRRPRWSPPSHLSPRSVTPTPPPLLSPTPLSAWRRSISVRMGTSHPTRAPAGAASLGEDLTWLKTPPGGNSLPFWIHAMFVLLHICLCWLPL